MQSPHLSLTHTAVPVCSRGQPQPLHVQVVLRGQGKNFCAGIDLQTLDSIAALMDIPDSARAAAAFRHRILRMQVQPASP